MDSLDVDVFCSSHPILSGRALNAHMDNRKVNALNAKYPMRLQASAFNVGGRLYAPTYRQAHIGVLPGKTAPVGRRWSWLMKM